MFPRSKLIVTALVSVLLGTSVFLQAQDDANTDFVPAIVLSRSGEFPAELEARIVEIVSDALARAALRSSADQVYGSDLQTAGGASPSTGVVQSGGPLSALTKAIVGLDDQLKRIVSGELSRELAALPEGSELNFGVQFGFLPRSAVASVISESAQPLREAGRVLGLVNGARVFFQQDAQTRSIAAGAPTTSGVPALDTIANLQPVVIMADDLPPGVSLNDLDRGAYEWLSTDTQQHWLPMRIDLDISVDRRGMSLLFMSFVKPAVTWLGINRDVGAMNIEGLSYQPGFFSPTTPGLMHIRLDRQYGLQYVPQSSDPMRLRTRFGYLGSRTFLQCNGDRCVDFVNRVPTIRARMSAGSGSFFPRSAADLLARTLGPISTFHILLREVPIDISNPEGPSVIERESSIPIVVNVATGFGNYSRFVINEDSSVLGFNVYERLVGSQITDALTGDLRSSVQSLDAEASAALQDALRPIEDLFR